MGRVNRTVYVAQLDGALRGPSSPTTGLLRLTGATELPRNTFPKAMTWTATSGDIPTTYTYDALSRMSARGATTSAYNGDGTLVSQIAGGTTTRYTQDLAAPLSQVLQIKVGTAPISEYLYGLNRLASQNGSTKTWYAADALGSVRRTVTDAGVPMGIVNYDPWGTPESGTVPTFGFTGEVQDVAAGLVNLRARWYSTTQGKFTAFRWRTSESSDTTPYSHHPYAYALSNPVNWSDPSGKFCLDGITTVFCGIAAVAAAVASVPATTIALAGAAIVAVPATVYLYTGAPNAETNRQNVARGFDFALHGGQGYVWTGGAVPPPTYTNRDFSNPQRLGNPGLSPDERQECKVQGIPLLQQQGLYTSGRWETPIQMPLALMQSLVGLPPLIKAVTKAEKPADIERILQEANVPFSVRVSDWRVPFEPVYELSGFGRPVEIRVHLNEDLTIAQFRIGIQLVEPKAPVYPKAGQAWLPDDSDIARLQQVDSGLIQAFGEPVNEFAPRPGGWAAQYIDPLGWVYVDELGHLVGLRSNAGHINRVP